MDAAASPCSGELKFVCFDIAHLLCNTPIIYCATRQSQHEHCADPKPSTATKVKWQRVFFYFSSSSCHLLRLTNCNQPVKTECDTCKWNTLESLKCVIIVECTPARPGHPATCSSRASSVRHSTSQCFLLSSCCCLPRVHFRIRDAVN